VHRVSGWVYVLPRLSVGARVPTVCIKLLLLCPPLLRTERVKNHTRQHKSGATKSAACSSTHLDLHCVQVVHRDNKTHGLAVRRWRRRRRSPPSSSRCVLCVCTGRSPATRVHSILTCAPGIEARVIGEQNDWSEVMSSVPRHWPTKALHPLSLSLFFRVLRFG
jgi:hypothetical protein